MKVMVWILGSLANPYAFDKKSKALPFNQTVQSGCLTMLFFLKKKASGKGAASQAAAGVQWGCQETVCKARRDKMPSDSR